MSRLLGSFSGVGGSAAGAVTGNNLLRPAAASSTRSAAVLSTTTTRLNTWDPRPSITEAPAAAPAAATLPALPNMQPISSVLARQLQREQQQRKRLRQQLQSLERKLHQHSSTTSSGMAADSLDWLDFSVLPSDRDEDPLFSSSTPPSVQQLQRLVVHRRAQLMRATSSSISDVTRVAQQLQDIASHLGVHLNTIIPLVARHEPLLLQPPHQLPPRLALLAAALQLHPHSTAQLLCSTAPQLLGTSLRRLQSNLVQLDRVLSSRGLQLAEMLRARPDLLTQNPGSVEAKLEQLPGALGMSRQRVRQLVSQRPELLRRSVNTISHRYHSLRQLFNIPDSFVEEFVVQEPELLCMSATTLKAKFDSLLRRYGAFADDVLDMVLVDPALLINADPTAAPPAPTIKASRKKQQRLLLEQQQLLQQQQISQQQQQQEEENVQPPLQPLGAAAAASTGDVWQAAVQPDTQGILQPAAVQPSIAAQQQQQQQQQLDPPASEQQQQLHLVVLEQQEQQQQQQKQQQEAEDSNRPEEPWEVVLRLRLERRQAAKQRRKLRQQQRKQEEDQQLRLRGTQHAQGQQVLASPASSHSRGSSSRSSNSHSKMSPVRRLLAFAAATGLSAEQALMLWQQEPELSQLPVAAVGRQVAELSVLLGLTEEGVNLNGSNSSSSSSSDEAGQSLLAAAAAGGQQQQWQPGGEASGPDNSNGSSAGVSSPVLQVLVKEPMLLVLSYEQLGENMQGLADLLGLQAPTPPAAAAQRGGLQASGGLLPLLCEHPGLLLLTPDVAEYRLQHLAGLLQLSVPRTLQLVLQQPQLLSERPVLLASRLGSLCTLLGVARGVASECVLREPRVLCVDESELQSRWQTLVGRFGWAPDALDVVMADPAALMRDSMDE